LLGRLWAVWAVARPSNADHHRPASTNTDVRNTRSATSANAANTRRRTSRPVRRVLCPLARAAAIHLGLPLPTGSSGLPAGSGGQPSNACAGRPLRVRPSWPCSGWGLPSHPGHPGCWWALTPPFHPYRP